MKTKTNNLMIAFAIICLILYTIFDYFEGDTIYLISAKFVNHVQENISEDSFLNTLFKIPSFAVSNEIFAIILVSTWIFDYDKIRVIKFFTYVFIAAFLDCFLKMVYAKPRPYMVFGPYYTMQANVYVEARSCEIDFGNPSGHAFIGATFYCIFCYYIFELLNIMPNEADNLTIHQKKKNYRIIGLIILCLLIFSIGFSRIYLGVHSMDQIFLGWVWALTWMKFAYDFDLKYEMFLRNIIFKSQKSLIIVIVILKLMTIILTILPFIVFSFGYSQDIHTQWFENMIISNCVAEGTSIDQGLLFGKGDYIVCASICVILGILLGLCISKGTYEGNGTLKNWKIKHYIFRPLGYLVCALIFLPLIFLLNCGNTNLIYGIICILIFIFGIAIILLPPYTFKIINLDLEGDFMRLLNIPYVATANNIESAIITDEDGENNNTIKSELIVNPPSKNYS